MKQEKTEAEKLYEWWSIQELYQDEDGDEYLEIGLKGESNYQNNIDKCTEGDNVFCMAEPTNPYDKNAIKVCIDKAGKRTIGYLPRDIAKLLSPILKGIVLDAPIQSIAGGYDDKEYKGVWIRLYLEFNHKKKG